MVCNNSYDSCNTASSPTWLFDFQQVARNKHCVSVELPAVHVGMRFSSTMIWHFIVFSKKLWSHANSYARLVQLQSQPAKQIGMLWRTAHTSWCCPCLSWAALPSPLLLCTQTSINWHPTAWYTQVLERKPFHRPIAAMFRSADIAEHGMMFVLPINTWYVCRLRKIVLGHA